MDALTIFGSISVLVMLIAYALEEKSRTWILIFAFACFSSSLYGYLARTWPFAFVEVIWGFVALNRWKKRRSK